MVKGGILALGEGDEGDKDADDDVTDADDEQQSTERTFMPFMLCLFK